MSNSVTDWIGQLKAGDEDAIQKLWDRYATKLAALARKNLGDLPKTVTDEHDVAQSVFHSICRGAAAGRFTELNSRAELWWLLLAITRQKTIDRFRSDTAIKRGGGRVETECDLKDRCQGDDRFSLDNLLGRDPSPEFMVMLEEQYECLLSKLRDEKHRQIAKLRVEGYTVAEVAEQMKISHRAVERKLQEIRLCWSNELSIKD